MSIQETISQVETETETGKTGAAARFAQRYDKTKSKASQICRDNKDVIREALIGAAIGTTAGVATYGVYSLVTGE